MIDLKERRNVGGIGESSDDALTDLIDELLDDDTRAAGDDVIQGLDFDRLIRVLVAVESSMDGLMEQIMGEDI